MKLKLAIFLGLVTMLIIGLANLFRQTAGPAHSVASTDRGFEVRGMIREVDRQQRTVTIEHETIPGFMPAMTMPFSVKDAALLEGLHVDERVRFHLMVTTNDSWISQFEPVSPAPAHAATPSADRATLAQPKPVEALQAGETVPEFELVDQDGQPWRLRDYRGKLLLVTFIYTRCPLPNFCPLMSSQFASLEQRLQKEFPGRFHLLSVSFDPQFDTPAVLKAYAARYQREAGDWTFATGTPEQIEVVTGLFGLFHAPENGLITHDLRTALIAPDGTLVQVWKSNAWTPYEVHRRVREVLSHSVAGKSLTRARFAPRKT